MNKPVLLIVDDDPQVLAAVRRDLRSRYRENYTVISASSGQEALDAMRELKSRGDSLAMIISDQRMPGMMGSEVLAKSRAIYPLARQSSAHRLLGYRCGREGHQRGASRSLSFQALGSAGGTSLSRDRRSARCLAGRISARSERTAAGGAPVVAAIACHQGFSGQQSDSLSLARCRRATPDARALLDAAGVGAEELPALFFDDGIAGAAQSRSAPGGRAARPTDDRLPSMSTIL